MKKSLSSTPDTVAQVLLGTNVDAKDPEAITPLDEIGGGTSRERKSEAGATRAPRSDGPFFLESLYFHSFGQRTLLTREQELELAKTIDQGTFLIRQILRHVLQALSRLNWSPSERDTHRTLLMVKRLNGLSAAAIDKADQSLTDILTPGPRQHTLSAPLTATLKKEQRALRAARIPLEHAKDELVRCNLRLVVDIAKKYVHRGLTFLDLVQEGNLGLMKGAERYQYRKGFKFSTYATWWIRQGISRALADQSRTIRIPVHQTEASHRILRATKRLGQQLGRPARTEEVASALGMRPSRLTETVQAFQEPIALERPVGDGSTEFGELLPDLQTVPPDTHVHQREMARQLERILSLLTPREQTVIQLRFGIGHDQAYTLEEVGKVLFVTRERIRQIESKALSKLRTPEIKELFSAIQ